MPPPTLAVKYNSRETTADRLNMMAQMALGSNEGVKGGKGYIGILNNHVIKSFTHYSERKQLDVGSDGQIKNFKDLSQEKQNALKQLKEGAKKMRAELIDVGLELGIIDYGAQGKETGFNELLKKLGLSKRDINKYGEGKPLLSRRIVATVINKMKDFKVEDKIFPEVDLTGVWNRLNSDEKLKADDISSAGVYLSENDRVNTEIAFSDFKDKLGQIFSNFGDKMKNVSTRMLSDDTLKAFNKLTKKIGGKMDSLDKILRDVAKLEFKKNENFEFQNGEQKYALENNKITRVNNDRKETEEKKPNDPIKDIKRDFALFVMAGASETLNNALDSIDNFGAIMSPELAEKHALAQNRLCNAFVLLEKLANNAAQ